MQLRPWGEGIDNLEVKLPHQLFPCQHLSPTRANPLLHERQTYLKKQLVQLKHGNLLPTAGPPSTAEKDIHAPNSIRLRLGITLGLHESFRPEQIHILPKHLRIPRHGQRVMPNCRSSWEVHALDCVAARRDRLIISVINGKSHAESLQNDGLQVGEFKGLLEGDGAIGGDIPGGNRIGDGAFKRTVCVGSDGEVHDGTAEGVGGGVRAGEDLEVGFTFDFVLGESVADEATDHVVPGFGLVLLSFLEALCHDLVDDALDTAGAGLIGFLRADQAQAHWVEDNVAEQRDVEDEGQVLHDVVDACHVPDDILTVLEVAEGLAVA